MNVDDARTSWSRGPLELQLRVDQADVWRVSLDAEPATLRSAESTLSADETQRALHFHFEKDRNRFLVSHGSLRDILARYLKIEPSQLKFSANEFRKPFLAEHAIEFSLSHSGNCALIAITRGRKIGVDVEQIREDIEIESLASRNFSPREFSELIAASPEHRTIGFFNCWTRKEAYIKAHGLGLSLPLDSFDVSLPPDEPVILHATRPDANEAARWTILGLDVQSGYAGALAVEGRELELRFWDWRPRV